MKTKIELTEEQRYWLLCFLNREWDAEVEYQDRNNIPDITYLEDLLDVYTAVLGKTDSWILAMSFDEDIKDKENDLKKLKEKRDE